MAAAVSTSMGAPNVANIMGLGPDLLGFVLAADWWLPPAIAVVSPAAAAGRRPQPRPHQLRPRSATPVFYPFILIFGAGMYLRYRKPSHL